MAKANAYVSPFLLEPGLLDRAMGHDGFVTNHHEYCGLDLVHREPYHRSGDVRSREHFTASRGIYRQEARDNPSFLVPLFLLDCLPLMPRTCVVGPESLVRLSPLLYAFGVAVE